MLVICTVISDKFGRKIKFFSLTHYPPAMSVTINKAVNLSQVVLKEKPAARNIIKILLSKTDMDLVVFV